jgi:hypothetical protein
VCVGDLGWLGWKPGCGEAGRMRGDKHVLSRQSSGMRDLVPRQLELWKDYGCCVNVG